MLRGALSRQLALFAELTVGNDLRVRELARGKPAPAPGPSTPAPGRLMSTAHAVLDYRQPKGQHCKLVSIAPKAEQPAVS